MRWLPSLRVLPWIAAAVLANSVYNLQASALFVFGEQWIVFRTYLIQVVLLALVTWILLPKWGILGYGWADAIVCGAYFFLHVKLARKVRLSYRRVAAWAVASLLRRREQLCRRIFKSTRTARQRSDSFTQLRFRNRTRRIADQRHALRTAFGPGGAFARSARSDGRGTVRARQRYSREPRTGRGCRLHIPGGRH